jgi:hypothetical protein
MSADTINAGPTQGAKVELTSYQAQQLVAIIERRRGNVRIEQLRARYVRVVLIGKPGETVREHVLFPSASLVD